VEKLADIEQQQLQKYKLAVVALAEADAKAKDEPNNISREQIHLLEKEVDNERLKFSLSGYYAEVADNKRTKRQINEKNEPAKRQRQEAIENNELNKRRDHVTGQSVVLPHTRAELLSNQTEGDGNKSDSIDENSMVMMKFMAYDQSKCVTPKFMHVLSEPINHNFKFDACISSIK
ncbi:unnamed protein product, partial [Rotaria sp. Silwood2]